MGGSALGLSPTDGPLLLFLLSPMWKDEVDDSAVIGVTQKIISQSVSYAKSKGLYHAYQYMNYASQYQDVVVSYGFKNAGRLKRLQTGTIRSRCSRSFSPDTSNYDASRLPRGLRGWLPWSEIEGGVFQIKTTRHVS